MSAHPMIAQRSMAMSSGILLIRDDCGRAVLATMSKVFLPPS